MVCKNLLRGRMAEKGITQKALAEMLKISKNTLSSRINSKSPFNTQEIDQICSILGITDCAEKAEIFLQHSSHFRDSKKGR